MASRRPGEGKYAKVEREQRWLLASVPPNVHGASEINDRYLAGMNLRLRKVESDEEVIYKLAQKIRLDDGSPDKLKITNIYFDVDEYERLHIIQGASLTKRRWRLDLDGTTYAVDEFLGRHAGLILAEVELGESDALLPMPPFAIKEVTNDNRFSGGWLAEASESQLDDLLGEIRAGHVGLSPDMSE